MTPLESHPTQTDVKPMNDPRANAGGALPRWKRWIDCTIAIVLLAATTPIILLSIAVVRLTSSGPGIYSQTRMGLNRRPFTIYKIRTMAHNCEAATGARWATANDARATLVGRFLRNAHLDELPQLWNVLRGDMTLVGPRPERPEIVEKIEPFVPGYGVRLTVLPGVTGLAQVQLPADRDLESVRRKIRYDGYYATHLGPWLDLRLIAVTAFKIFGLLSTARAILRIPGSNLVEIDRSESMVDTAEVEFIAEVPSRAPTPDLFPA